MGEFVVMLVQQRLHVIHHLRAFGDGHITPGLKRFVRMGGGGAHLFRRRKRHMGNRLAGGGVYDGQRLTARGIYPDSVDEVLNGLSFGCDAHMVVLVWC